MTQAYEEKTILDYIEGDLSADERARFEKTLEDDAKLGTLVERMAKDREALRALPREQPIAGSDDVLVEVAQERMERAMLLDDEPPLRSRQSAERALFRIDHFLAWSAVAAMLVLTASMMVMTLYDPTTLELAQLPSDAGLAHFADEGDEVDVMLAQAEPTESLEESPAAHASQAGDSSQAMAMGRASVGTRSPAQQAAPQGAMQAATQAVTRGEDVVPGEAVTPYPALANVEGEADEVIEGVLRSDESSDLLTLGKPASLGTPLTTASEFTDEIEVPDLLVNLDDSPAAEGLAAIPAATTDDSPTPLPAARLTLTLEDDSFDEVDRLLERLNILPMALESGAAGMGEGNPLALGGAVVAPGASVPGAASSVSSLAAKRADAESASVDPIVVRVASADPGEAQAAVLAWASEKNIVTEEEARRQVQRKATSSLDNALADQAEPADHNADIALPVTIHLNLTREQLELLQAMLARTAGTSAVVAQADLPGENAFQKENQKQPKSEAIATEKRHVRIVITRQTQ